MLLANKNIKTRLLGVRLITQKNKFGCGIACVASVLNISYERALEIFPLGKVMAKKRGFLCSEMIFYLKKAGRNYIYRYLNKKHKRKIYKNGTIVFIKRSVKYPSGHYLCRFGDKWMDPWINFQDSKDIQHAKSGFRKRLPGIAIYGIFK